MKLYATTTSERASKGQGGNNFLDINIQIEKSDKKRVIAGTINVYNDKENDCYKITVYPLSGDTRESYSWKIQKGEKQKGECNGRHDSVQAILDCHICQNDPLLD